LLNEAKMEQPPTRQDIEEQAKLLGSLATVYMWQSGEYIKFESRAIMQNGTWGIVIELKEN